MFAGNRHQLPRYRALDQAGIEQSIMNWQQIATFEQGTTTPNPSGFDAISSGGGGSLTTNEVSALRGQFGLQVTYAGAGSTAFGRFTAPNGETTLTVEFFLDINTLTMANGDQSNFLFILSPGAGGNFAVINLLRSAGVYFFNILAKDDAGANVTNVSRAISDEPVLIRIELQASSAPGADDGFMRTYLNGVLLDELQNIDNDTHNATEVRIGALAAVDAGTSGSLYIDNCRWANEIK